MNEHHEALESDLLKIGYELKDVGHSLSWSALHSFISNIEPDSALCKELDPEVFKWNTAIKTNAILADIYDVLALINSNLVAIGSKKPAKTPTPYPRPTNKKDNNHIGEGAVPADELRQIFADKRRQRMKDV